MYANTDLAYKDLGWKAKYTLKQMCKLIFRTLRNIWMKDKLAVFNLIKMCILGEDFWKWQTMNPNGYKSSEQNSSTPTPQTCTNHKITNGHS